MKNIFKVSFLCMSMVLCFACDKLEDVNKNPNGAEVGVVGVDRLITGAQLDFSETIAIMGLDVASDFMQQAHWTQFDWEQKVNTRSCGTDLWEGYFGNPIRNVNYILDYASEADANYRGMALTVKAYMDYMLTSSFGDIPYSEGGKADKGILLPKYDTQKDVFQGILADLEEANTLLTSGTNPLKGDFLLDNSPMKWRQFANSLRIRVLIAQSKQVSPTAELTRIVGDPTKYPLMKSNDDQPALDFDGQKKHPRDHTQPTQVSFSYVSEMLVETLLAYDDDRLYMYALKTADVDNPYVGCPADGSNAESEMSRISAFVQLSNVNYALQSVWMHYAEVEFLLAEAAEKGWIPGGSAQAEGHYKKGIEASYKYQFERQVIGLAGIRTDAGTVDYTGDKIDNMAAWDPAYYEQPGVKYNVVPANNLQQIAEQKWIALYYDMENWFSYTRSGLPKLTEPNGGVLPLRFQYPGDELAFNEENYKAAVAIQGPDQLDTKMWILK